MYAQPISGFQGFDISINSRVQGEIATYIKGREANPIESNENKASIRLAATAHAPPDSIQ